jgi:hemoglobin
MLCETVDRAIINDMVRAFYSKILVDEKVGPYFIRSLGEDMNSGKWPGHLSTLNDFWLLMMKGIPGYNGHPFPPHAFLGQLYLETFDRWLELFNETVHEFFVPEIAEQFYKKSQIIAQQFIEKLDLHEEED